MIHYPARIETDPRDKTVTYFAPCGIVSDDPAVFARVKDGNSASAVGVTCAECKARM